MVQADELFTVVTWPMSQTFMDLAGFEDNSIPISDPKNVSKYGLNAYAISVDWLDSIGYPLTPKN